MGLYNGEFTQCLEVIIKADDHQVCLDFSKYIKKQCEAWAFNLKYKEHKSARKGAVLMRDILINQKAYASDIVIFKEAVRRICLKLNHTYNFVSVKFIDRGTEPLNDLRKIS